MVFYHVPARLWELKLLRDLNGISFLAACLSGLPRVSESMGGCSLLVAGLVAHVPAAICLIWCITAWCCFIPPTVTCTSLNATPTSMPTQSHNQRSWRVNLKLARLIIPADLCSKR